EVIVGICLDRSPEILVAVLGVLKAGGAYLPLDPSLPGARLAHMVGEAEAKVVVTQAAHAARLAETIAAPLVRVDGELDGELDGEHDVDPASPITPDQAAYVIYTSGSTGEPKGVVVEHRGLSSLVTMRSFDGQVRRRVLQVAPFGFDASVSDF